jgi:uncharacterized protein
MKYLLFYEPGGAEMPALAREHYPAHAARWVTFREAGTLLAIGPYGDGSGALAIFTTKDAAEEFAREDPFVLRGVVAGWSIKEWNEALLPG